MTDIVDSATRSRMMRGIRGKNTKPELLLRRGLHARGFRFRLHCQGMSGRPDIVLPKYKAAIFVHGCFWHRHAGCPKAATPSTRVNFWKNKFAENTSRDKRNVNQLSKEGWRVLIVWECELKAGRAPETIDQASAWLTGMETT